MPNEIDVADLREALVVLFETYQHGLDCDPEGCFAGCPTLGAREKTDAALPALLDEVERLRETVAHAERQAEADEDASMRQSLRVAVAEDKLERVRAVDWGRAGRLMFRMAEKFMLEALDQKYTLEEREQFRREALSIKADCDLLAILDGKAG